MCISIEELLVEGRTKLAAVGFDLSLREANLFLAHVLGWSEAELLARTDCHPIRAQIEEYRQMLGRRSIGEPVAYILGEKEFYGRILDVDDRVLIPRPETEHLVEHILKLELPNPPTILDIGTGSGCLAVALAIELPQARVIATDISVAALVVASNNFRRHGIVPNVSAVATDLAGSVDLNRIDLVVSNPPYVALEAISELSPEIVEHEPSRALFAGAKGDIVIRRLLDELSELRAGAWLVIEIGYDQKELILSLASSSRYRTVSVEPDYSGKPRIALLQLA
jgi:release factor glutamine methyltransferase